MSLWQDFSDLPDDETRLGVHAQNINSPGPFSDLLTENLRRGTPCASGDSYHQRNLGLGPMAT